MRFVALRSAGAPSNSGSAKIELGDALFYPATPVYSTATVKRVRFTGWFDGDDLQGWFAIQYSNDGIRWSSFPIGVASVDDGEDGYTHTLFDDGVWQPRAWLVRDTPVDDREPATDRTISTKWYACPGDFQSVQQPGNEGDPTPLTADRLFCRFGWVVLNATQDTGTTPPRGGRGAIAVEVDSIDAGTVAGGPLLCTSGGGSGSVATPVFTALTGPIRTSLFTKVRMTVETEATDEVEVTVGYQRSDDGVTWGTPTTITGTPVVTEDGIEFPEDWKSLTVTDSRFVRFGAWVENASGSDVEVRGAVVTVRIDWRES